MLFPKKQKRKKDPYALVLGGGGAKGAFQIGALKALNEFGIEFEAASGASVGALNAALVAMGDAGRAEELWKGLTIEDIVVVPDGLLKEGKLDFSIRNLLRLRSAGRKIFKDFGLDTAPLRALIARYADEKAIRSGGVDLGLVTFEISDLSPRELFLGDIPEGKLVDYLLASASFPLFKRAEINGKKFTDGGVYDNIPYAMIKERGYRKIIVIDVSGLGLNRRPNITGTETIYIKNSIDMGSVFDFSRGFITDFMRLGYLDTLKVFGKLSGIRYFYDDDPRLTDLLGSILTREEARIRFILESSGKKTEGLSLEQAVRAVLPQDMARHRNLPACLAECAALSLCISRNEHFTFGGFVSRIERRYREASASDLRTHEREFTLFFKALIEKAAASESGFCPFEYSRALESLFPGDSAGLPRKALEFIHPEVLPARLFFHILEHTGRKRPPWKTEE